MKAGEKITLLFPYGVVLTEARAPRTDELSKCASEQPIWGYVWTNPGSGGQGRVNLGDEGITWLRGWHLPDSEQVAAARVAIALGKTEPMRQPLPHMPLLAQAVVDITARVLTNLITKDKKP